MSVPRLTDSMRYTVSDALEVTVAALTSLSLSESSAKARIGPVTTHAFCREASSVPCLASFLILSHTTYTTLNRIKQTQAPETRRKNLFSFIFFYVPPAHKSCPSSSKM